ncbi:MAG: aminotransferase class IV [Rhizobiales bacterium]|nr:aminotransferase class IV [Hyphomicrobiales bacterium]MBI3673268.1 aminotransferase class IV [Hyphomicrobiales bacterium]
MSLVWFNGRLIDGPLPLEAHDRGLLLGDGLFETLLVVNRAALWLHMHLARLEGSANELGIGFDRDAADAAVADLLDQASEVHHVLRLTLTRGPGARGLAGVGGEPTLIATLDAFDAGLMLQPVAMVTASVRRNPASPASRLKTLSYIDNIAAAREAKARGVEEALMLNTRGAAASASIANLFLVKGRTLITPGRDQGILTGVTRQALLAAAHRAGFETKERVVKPAELLTADGVFLTNSLRLIRPVKSLDGKPVGKADLSPLADVLCAAARLQCGRDPRLL